MACGEMSGIVTILLAVPALLPGLVALSVLAVTYDRAVDFTAATYQNNGGNSTIWTRLGSERQADVTRNTMGSSAVPTTAIAQHQAERPAWIFSATCFVNNDHDLL
ncbi:hypothetical protein GTA08_BOTSDO08621 [Botryosphaeria dothidea]|uniref:Uncharacterized protein n=1 Tax=Botryosphaeria dothidea TaxID=55169 RepID=A0A8H4IL93_9PEZI|nr:hypothetical protein GTA08_BOTSDO08621 [Botryosphaeria dothidea]